MSKPILYAFKVSSCSWRVRIALAYKKIDFEPRVVNLPNMEQKKPEFLKMNPMGQIPVLQVNNQYIAESLPILEYLEEVYPNKPLLPKDPMERAKVREISEIISSGIQPLQNPKVAAHHSKDQEERTAWMHFYIHRGFSALEPILNNTSSEGKFCFGNSLSIADCCFVPQVYNAAGRFKVDMAPYPKITSIYEALMELEEVKAGHPDSKFG